MIKQIIKIKVGGIRVESQKSKVKSCGLRLRAAGMVIFTMAAFSHDTGTVN